MVVETKWFGTIDISEDKIITFDMGIMGFEDYKKFKGGCKAPVS